MPTVPARTDHVVVVGAGLAGLAAALRLAGAGRSVTVLERHAGPGGLAGRHREAGYTFDTGPSVLTMPEVIDQTLGFVGEQLTDRLRLRRLDPIYRAFYPDGEHLDVCADPAGTAEQIRTLAGPEEAAGYERFVAWLRALHQAQRTAFIDRPLERLRDLSPTALVGLAALGGFRRLEPAVGRFLRDPRVRRAFTFQSLYVGLAPQQALALYAVVSYMDTVGGVWFPEGGMHAVPEALAAAAGRHGVRLRYRTAAAWVETAGGRARAVHTAAGERVPADAVVLATDLPTAYRQLLDRPVRPAQAAPSCVVLHLGGPAAFGRIAHHNLHFGRAWRDTFAELGRRGSLMSDPSLLVGNPSRTDPALAPPGRQTYSVLAPVPNAAAGLDWAVLGPRYAAELLATLERRGYVGLDAGTPVRRLVTPADWAAAGLTAGTPFAAAHTLRQTGPFRAGARVPGLDNVVTAGAWTHPGVGVPMVLISGRLAAERLLR